MERTVTMAGIEGLLEEYSFPAVRTNVATELEEVTLVADGARFNLGAVVDESGADVFDAPEDLLRAIEVALSNGPSGPAH